MTVCGLREKLPAPYMSGSKTAGSRSVVRRMFGGDVYEAQEIVKAEVGVKSARVAVIGQAGEKQVCCIPPFAATMDAWRGARAWAR
jgi:hypothetical protein